MTREEKEAKCERCGDAMVEHINTGLAWICHTATFKAKPEPMKAKPGVVYYNRRTSQFAVGLLNGALALTETRWTVFHLSADWTEQASYSTELTTLSVTRGPA